MSSTDQSSADILLEAIQLNKHLSVDSGIHETTLKMLAGTLIPDSGQITISGFSMAEAPLQARQRIGFLPDTPPLYTDMRVIDYLRFCAKLRRVSKANSVEKLDAVLTQCDLNSVARKRIAQLSKGFRQRVGLAMGSIQTRCKACAASFPSLE